MNLSRNLAGLALALTSTALCVSVSAQALAPELDAAMARAHLPREAVAVWVQEVGSAAPPRASHRAGAGMNPASVMKLVTTYAALDLLGPNFTWATPVYLDGRLKDGVLQGSVFIQGQGDPKLVVERLWLLLRRLRGMGIERIGGDIVLDHTAFEPDTSAPGDFDGEGQRPYNAAPDALLINFKSTVFTFVPDVTARRAHVHMEPPLVGVQWPRSVPLSTGECPDYRAALKASFADASRVRFGGAYAASCGERAWPVAYADPASFAERAVAAMWGELGGRLDGKVRDGRLSPTAVPAFEMPSLPLSELVRDINKFSNNVMARQLFLTLAWGPSGRPDVETPVATLAGARSAVARWWQQRIESSFRVPAPLLDNGSGLSRQERISAAALAALLQSAYRSAVMSELMSSLPVSGVDGTLRRSRAKTPGVAHLKTGSLRDVAALAGYVDGASGRRYVLVALVNHAQVQGARGFFDALIDWTAQDS